MGGNFFDSMDNVDSAAAEPSSGVYHATLDFDALEQALAIPAALRRGSGFFGNTLSPKKQAPMHREPQTGGRQPQFEPPQPQPRAHGAAATPSPQPAVRSVRGVHVPSWAVVGGSPSPTPSVQPAAARPPQDPSAAYVQQFQQYRQQQQQQEQEQQRNEQQYQREREAQEQEARERAAQEREAQGRARAPQRSSAEDAHDQLMARAVERPPAQRPRSGAAGSLGYTAAGPFAAAHNPYTADVVGMARGQRQSRRASRRDKRLASRERAEKQEQQRQQEREQPLGADGFGGVRLTDFRGAALAEPDGRAHRLGQKLTNAQRKYAADPAAEVPSDSGHAAAAPRMLPSLGGLAMGFGGLSGAHGPLHGRRSVLGV